MTKVPASVRASVCMATYNGRRFLREQVDSILEQLEPDDELVIVDDASTDGTAELAEELPDARIKVFRHERNAGYITTFEDALSRATGEVLLLSDQDDVWLPAHRNALVAGALDAGVAASNLRILGQDGFPGPWRQSDWLLRHADSERPWRNLAALMAGNRPYFGCAMAFHSSLREVILPFPAFLDESHDQWIAVCGNVAGRMVHVEDRTVARRLHDANASSPKPRALPAVIHSRRLVVQMMLEARSRLRAR